MVEHATGLTKKTTALSRLAPWFLVVLLGLVVVQGAFVWKDFIRPWLGPIRRFGLIASFQRGEILFIGYNEAKYVRFLDAYLPKDATVVLPDEANASFTDQSLMQFYLFPRPIEGCAVPASETCLAYARDPNSFLLAIKDFPPAELAAGKVFVPFPEPYNQLKGVYVPEKLAAALTVPAPEIYDRLPNISLAAPFLEGGTLLLFFLLGSVFVSLILPRPTWIDVLSLSIPVAMGVLSWGIFLTSYLGVPITLATAALWAVLLSAAGIAAHRLFRKPFKIFPVKESLQSVRKLMEGDRLAFLMGLMLLVWFGLSALVAVGSSYSFFDAIANWYMKGYAMAAKGTIWAGEAWGGHVLAYPMNIQLSTAVFQLVDGDLLPGSKLLFPLLAFSLLLGCYQFLRRHAVGREYALGADLLIFTVPLFFQHATTGLANLPFTAYLVLGVLWVFDGFWFGRINWTLIGGILLAFSAWTRPEGIGFGLAMLAALFAVAVFGLKIRRVGKYLLASLLPLLVFPVPWLLLLGIREMRRDQVGSTLQGFLAHGIDGKAMLGSIGQIAAYAANYFTTWRGAGFAAVVCLLGSMLALIVRRHLERRLPLWMLAVTGVAWLIPAAMFFFVPFSNPDFHAFLDQSFDRAYLPALVLLTVSAFTWFGNPRPESIGPDEIKP